ncbi:diacylglycerol kinase family protein, partial [Oligoflexia bacterium]|nr:diacylglycerol kinase family protein [Oligoflexia bacterium]
GHDLMNFCCLVNKFAGGQQGRVLCRRLQELKEEGLYHGEVVELALDKLEEQTTYAASFDCVLVAGGDGTVSLVLSYLMVQKVKVGILPLGTGNDLAKELGVYKLFSAKDPLPAIRFFETADVRKLSVWKLKFGAELMQELIFCNYVSFGFDAAVVSDFTRLRAANGWLARLFGKIANRALYALAASKNLNHFLPQAVQVRDLGTDQVISSPKRLRSLFFSNISSVMGLGSSNKASDGFDQCLELNVITTIWNYLAMLLKFRRPWPTPVAYSSVGWEISGLAPTSHVQVDGEAKDDLKLSTYRIELAGWVYMLGAVQNARILNCEPVSPGGTKNTSCMEK